MGKNYYLKDRDILDQALEHSWGKSADAKAKEKAYNREYYQRHKEEILRKARQAGEGIQREARGIKEAITETSRRYPSNKELYYNYPDTRTTYGYGPDRYGKDAFTSNFSNRRRLEEAKSDYERYRNTPGASQTKERVRKAASKHSSTAAAINERAKAYRQIGPESKFDSKLVRDAQNAYSKLRNPKEMARRAGESAKNAVNSAKEYVDNAMGKNGRRGAGVGQEVADKLSRQAKDQRSRANRFRDSARKSVQRSNSSYQQYQDLRDNPNTKGYAPQAYDNAVNEAHRAIEYAGQYAKNAKRSSASAAAANAASNAANRPGYDTRYDSSIVRGVQNTKAKARGAMTKAEKAAQQAREDAKKRMKKWFNR